MTVMAEASPGGLTPAGHVWCQWFDKNKESRNNFSQESLVVVEDEKRESGELPTRLKLELPEGATVGSIVLVTWDVTASAEASAPNLEPGAQEGRIIEIEGHRVTCKFEWPDPDIVRNPLITTIDLVTAEDSHWGGIVESIESRSAGSRRS